ncbi:hypothetical protein [Paraburkholderia xenovorans]|uniref:hypothetical protein n=1 Tax=Paraburkholderia xenovorans TaxID=36873 RepID=UPI0038B6D47B
MKAIKLERASEEAVRCLSAHEIATLLRLHDAPAALMAVTPDVIALREVGLVQLLESEQGQATFALTAKGNAVLRVLGAG